VIKESAVTVSSACSTRSACPANWVVVATNPNNGFYAKVLTLRATAHNGSDDPIGETTVQVRQIPPGVTFAVTGRVPATGPPKTIDITAEQVEWAEAPAGPERYPAFGTNEITMSPSGIGAYQVQGRVTNPYKTSFQLMNVTVLLRDAGGKLVGGETTWLDRIGPRETKPFSVDITDQVATVPARAEAIAYPWGAASWLTAQR
jgi:hypothetical protein